VRVGAIPQQRITNLPTSSSSYPRNSLLAFEIAQQPEVWPTTLERVRSGALPQDLTDLPVILCGAGTSAYAASSIAEAWPQASAIPTTDLLIQSPAEIGSALPFLRRGGLLISLARSGDSPESTAVVVKIQNLFPLVKHVAIVCNPDGRLANTAGVQVILLDSRTNDRSLAMTASFSNLVLAGLALKHRQLLMERLPEICRRVSQALLQSNDLMAEIANHCKGRIVILTSCMQALAREVALKIVELTDGRVIAMPETFLGFRHGGVGFAREDTPILCFLSSDPRKRLYEQDLISGLREKRLARIIVVGDDPSLTSECDWFIPAIAPFLPDWLRTPFEVPLAQLLAYHVSLSAGVDPDNPSPKGTITRVVRPFRIHQDTESAS
jgi:tagatose-6-phosphate ketose/aldose isomerase